MVNRIFSLALMLVLAFPPQIHAGENADQALEDEVTALREIIDEQEAIIEDLSARLESLEERLALIQAKGEEKKEAKPLPSWVEKLKVYGDYRFRFENIDEEGKKGRQRDRMRLRLGVDAKVNDWVDLGIRLASGGFDPVSTNQTFSGAFSTKDFGLDLAYFDWHPGKAGSVHVIGGKMKNHFVTVGGSQLLWDSDLTPEGLALKLSGSGERTTPFLNLGYLWAEERGGASDSKLYALQGGFTHKTSNGSHVTLGAGVFNYSNMKGMKGLVDSTKGFGNSMTADPDPDVKDVYYANDFNEFELFGEFGFSAGNTPVTIYADYVTNRDAPTDDVGYLYGISLGKLKDPGSWNLGWENRRVEKDAVVGAFSDSDFIGGGTDGKGHKFSFAYQLSKNSTFGITYFSNDKKLSAPVDYDRWQVDFAFKF